MKPRKINSVSFEDIIFDGRNKAYGAYDIRKHYEDHLKKALALTLSMFLLLFLSPKIAAYFFPSQHVIPEKDVPIIPPISPENIFLPKPEIPKPQAQNTSAPSPSVDYRVPVVVNRILRKEPIPTNEQVNNSTGIIDNKTAAGDSNSNNFSGLDSKGTESGLPAPTEGEIIEKYVEIMPNFAGGDAALHKFIADHVKYPELGLQYELEGTVWVQFIVNKDGKITDPQIVKGLKGGFNEEALRVVKMMPAWNPGKQNGRAVPVYIKMPIKFTLRN